MSSLYGMQIKVELLCHVFRDTGVFYLFSSLKSVFVFVSDHRVTSVCIRRVHGRNDAIVRRARFDVKLSRKDDEFRRSCI
jgi:hypothetical protein